MPSKVRQEAAIKENARPFSCHQTNNGRLASVSKRSCLASTACTQTKLWSESCLNIPTLPPIRTDASATLKGTSMPRFLDWLANGSTKQTEPVNRYEGFTSNGAVVLRDRRGTRKAEIPDTSAKSQTLSSDPLAIYKPDGAKSIDPGRAMANFNGWVYAAVNAIA